MIMQYHNIHMYVYIHSYRLLHLQLQIITQFISINQSINQPINQSVNQYVYIYIQTYNTYYNVHTQYIHKSIEFHFSFVYLAHVSQPFPQGLAVQESGLLDLLTDAVQRCPCGRARCVTAIAIRLTGINFFIKLLMTYDLSIYI